MHTIFGILGNICCEHDYSEDVKSPKFELFKTKIFLEIPDILKVLDTAQTKFNVKNKVTYFDGEFYVNLSFFLSSISYQLLADIPQIKDMVKNSANVV